MFGSIMPWTNDRLGVGSPRSTNCLQTVLSPSGSTSGGNATRRRVARKRWSERTGPSVLELPLLRGVLELLLLRLDKSFLGREQFMEDESASSRLRRNVGGLGRHRGLQLAGVVLPLSSLLYLLPPLVPPPISLAQVFRRVLVQLHRRP
jgi:hypothetical protein